MRAKEIHNLKKIESSLNEKIIELEYNIERQKDKNIRLLAEFDNYKRRTRDEKIHLIRYSGEEIILSLLPALDDIQRTVDNAKNTDEKSIKEAINLVHIKLAKILKDKNIESFDSVEKNSIDLYASLKSLYLQNRNKKIANSTSVVETQNDNDWEEIDNN